MKIKFYAIAIAMIAFSANSFAQATATASTTAILVTPISIAKTTDMHFGTLSASASLGTATLDYANGVTPAGGVSVIDAALATTAVFTVTGSGSESISVSVPAGAITLTSGANTMTVDGFTCEQGTTTTLATGSKVLKVMGVLHVAANQLAGTYANAAGLSVTVNYN